MRIRTADGKSTLRATFGLVVGLGRPDGGIGVADDRRWMYLCDSTGVGMVQDAGVWMALGTGHLMHWSHTMAANQFVAVDHVGPEVQIRPDGSVHQVINGKDWTMST